MHRTLQFDRSNFGSCSGSRSEYGISRRSSTSWMWSYWPETTTMSRWLPSRSVVSVPDRRRRIAAVGSFLISDSAAPGASAPLANPAMSAFFRPAVAPAPSAGAAGTGSGAPPSGSSRGAGGAGSGTFETAAGAGSGAGSGAGFGAGVGSGNRGAGLGSSTLGGAGAGGGGSSFFGGSG